MSTTAPEPSTSALDALAFRSAAKPIIVVASDTTEIEAVNDRAVTLLTGGFESDDVVGRPLERWVVGNEHLGRDLRLGASGERVLLRLKTVDGEIRRFHVGVGPIAPRDRRRWVLTFDEASAVNVKLTALTHQVREANQRAQAIRRQNRMLEQVNQKLHLAEVELAAVNADLEHFAHIAAHDLEAPCRRQLMLVDTLYEELGRDVTDDVRQRLEGVRSQAQVLAAMIEGFRELTNLSGPGLERSTIDLRQLVESVLDETVPMDLRDDVDVDLPDAIEGYEPLVRVLFQNLVGNALKHGARPLDLRLTSTPGEGGRVFRVANASTSSSDLGNDLLKPFVRGVSSADGSGLGLSICRRVAERHGGDLWIESEPGVFRVSCTLGKANPSSDDRRQASTSSSSVEWTLR